MVIPNILYDINDIIMQATGFANLKNIKLHYLFKKNCRGTQAR